MNIINDVIKFIQTLSVVDIIFFMAVLVLMLLIITLIYFIVDNKNEEVISEKKEENKNILELKEITKALEEAPVSNIDLNDYEEEQEEKAIISYDELLKHKNDFAINYSEEENIADDLTIKKVDLDNLVNTEIKEQPKLNVTIISYEKEEAFLEALKTLQQKLN